ncbi:hypothetical protein ES319_A07G050500v1 [Gossypium barbadense]|uniref:Fe2OG dioxygenase domain-containing protein n=1 Tax=Gossypium barbadense TaxID=3634 RepID=A0A5J5UZL9_GOSBA|nr:hypothetical protein ES319_A07G050500v1 [Gossypium barbadense]
MSGDKNPSSFTIGNTAQEKGLDYVPECYVVSPSKSSSSGTEKARIPTIDMSRLRMNGNKRSIAIEELSEACRHRGFFQSNDVYNPVRYGTSLKNGADKVQFWRVFLKHYAHPLDAWIDSWPHNPPQYREKMGKYCAQVRNIALELMGMVIKSLGISPNRLTPQIDRGMQVMAVNCYPPCPKPEMPLGLPPHSDYTCLTIILQSSTGLEILDTDDGNWKMVPELHGVLQVHIGDHFEVMSNGVYKSVVHRATLNSEKTRVSIASLHSLGMDDKMETANELIDEQNPKRYKESSFKDFLDFLANNDIADGKHFIDTLKI